jgi:ankyrin repeat protein
MTDNEGYTPLHLAVENGASYEVIKVLMGHSASVLCMKKTFSGATPLHLAVYHNASLSVIQTLVEAHPMALRLVDSKGRLPLHVASSRGADFATFVYLVRTYHDSVKIKDKRGRTAYDVARKHKQPSDVLMLLKFKRGIYDDV